MKGITQHPKLRQLARDLHIADDGDCLATLRDHAISTVERLSASWDLETTDDLRLLVADHLSVKLEFLYSDEDVDAVAEKYKHVESHFRRLLRAEFLKSDTEGLLIDNPKPGKGGRDYLAIIDSRGQRAIRSYFTAWHELAHLLLYPRKQLVLEGFRRTPAENHTTKDPVESAVDHIAGYLAFWEPLFAPALSKVARGDLTFRAIESAAAAVAPGASLQAACLAAVRAWELPTAFLVGQISPKRDGSAPRLRVQIIANQAARDAGCVVRNNMRIPAESILSRTFNDPLGRSLSREEDQSWWDVSGGGPLPSLSWQVQSEKHGPVVYGLLTRIGNARS